MMKGKLTRLVSTVGERLRNPRSRWHVLVLLLRQKIALLGMILVVTTVLAAALAPWISPHDPLEIRMQDRLLKPSMEYALGTDELGRDVLSRIIYGARTSMMVGLVSITVAVSVGVPLGTLAAFYGGWLDSVIMRLMDSLAAFPSILLALAILSALGPSTRNAMVAIGIRFLPAFSRVARGAVLSVKENEYVLAARSVGASNRRLMVRTILPNCISPILVHASIGFSNAIIIEAALSFLGLGTQLPTPTWGNMLRMSRDFLQQNVWYSLSAGMAIMFSVLGFNLIGDGLRDVLDPRLRHGR